MTGHDGDPHALVRYALVAAVVTVAIAWAVYLVREALMLIYVSAIVAVGLGPIVGTLERLRVRRLPRLALPRWGAILVVYALLVGALSGIGAMVAPPLVSQAKELGRRAPQLLQQGQQTLVEAGLLTRQISLREAFERTPIAGTDMVATVTGAVRGLVGGVFGAVTILILVFYMLADAEAMVRTFVRLFPRERRPRVEEACLRVSAKVSAWLVAQLMLALVIGATAALGLFLLGVPYFYVLAAIAAVGGLVPVVGPILAAVPAVLVALSASPTLAIATAVFFFLQQQFENHVLVPRIMSRQVGISPAVVIVALLLGGSLWGLLGAVLAVPTAAVVQVLFEELVLDPTES